MRILAWDGKLKENVSLAAVPALLKKKGMVWADLENPTKEEMATLQKTFDLHPLTVEDCLGAIQLPKIDEYEKYVFLSINRIQLSGGTIHLGGVYFYLSSNYLLSVHTEQSSSLDAVYARIQKNPDILQRGPDFVLYQLVDGITDRYIEVLETIDKEVLDVETRILKGKLDGSLNHIIRTRRVLSNFKKSLAPQRDLIGKLARRDTRFVKSSSLMYFRDVADQVNRALSIVEGLRETVTGTFEAYLSIYSNRLNEVMKTLTVIATIFLPLTFLTGVYGMNFHVLPELEWQYGYFVFWGISVFITLIMILYFKRKNYL